MIFKVTFFVYLLPFPCISGFFLHFCVQRGNEGGGAYISSVYHWFRAHI